MDELKEKYNAKKEDIRKKYNDVIVKIAEAKGVDVGVAFDMLLAVCRGGDYIDGIVETIDKEKIYLDLDELNSDYFELACISTEIAKANGLID